MKDYQTSERTIGHVLADKAAQYGDKVYMYWHEVAVSYRQMDAAANRVGNSLAALGVTRGENVAVLLPNCPEYLYVWFGASKIGAVETPLNVAFRGEILRYILNNCEARVLVIAPEFLDRLRAVADELTSLKTVFVHDAAGNSPPSSWPNLPFELLPFPRLLQSSGTPPRIEVFPHDPGAIIYTSGTTGPSKGVVRPHHQIYVVSAGCARHMRYGPDDIIYTCLPLFHSNAQALTALPALLAGGAWVCGDRFSASHFWDDIRRYQCTAFNSLGSILYMLHRQPPTPADREHHARIALTAPAPLDIFHDFEERFGVKLIEVFGLTEGGTFLYNPLDAQRPGACGKPLPGYQVRIVDDNDYEVPPGVEGEIIVRHDAPWSLMNGYYNMPLETLKAFRNQWYHTGDFGKQDEDGYFYFVDRKKDALRRRGENISSFEVERAVNSHPAVLESAAIAAASEVGEDEVMIVVVLRKGHGATPEELIAHCEPQIPYFAVPRYVEFVDGLPKTPNEKVRKDVLRARGITGTTWDREEAGYQIKR